MNEYQKTTSFCDTELNSPIVEFAILLMSIYKGQYLASGTAIIIGPCLALTARHVIDDYWAQHHPHIALGPHHAEGKFSLQAVQIINGRYGALWDITSIWLSNYHDIAFIRLTPSNRSATDYMWRSPKLELIPPQKGDRIAGFGYRSTKTSVIERDEVPMIEVACKPTTTIGEVIEIHPEKRDIARLNYPCFQTNARFDGGMSGGPIFNDVGHLCGIICSNLPPSSEHETHISYVSLLWPLMATLLNIDRKGYSKSIYYPAIELARDGFLKVLNWEQVRLVRNERGEIVKVRFYPLLRADE